ncbi:ribosomal L1 domain-containing protein CG13096-like [Contarinia nasturtii]|uniref:ribosomal L1 domain-containing protein CG13096-like n=1 Tax=Contarinia nasturtii TaxID=265458 RepID=UPI0012D3FD2F|nr:ribosomal L1 domain-containing protein CG13096-like [Contarinia nasturtii]
MGDNSGNAIANRKRKAKDSANQQQSGPKLYSNRWMLRVYQEKPPFPEELFDTMFTKEKIETLVAALKLATDKEVEESKRLLESDYTYSLMIASHKVPHVPVHLSRILLKHSLHNEDSEVALFVKDLKRGRRLDFEPTIQHYENLLREKNVTKYRITVIPVNQLYNEYATFELRRKLSYLYDKFLVDSPIAAHVNGFLGSKMLKKGRLAIPVNLSKENLSDEIDKAMRKVFYKHVNQGITQNIQVGKHTMPNDQIADNIIDLLRQFGDIHPGGYKNVHKLFLRPQANVSVVIPLYVSADQPLDKTPVDRTAGEQVLQQHSKMAHSLLGDFNINEAGKLVQKRRPAASILDEEMLLSEDEADNQPPTKKPLTETETKDVKPAITNTPEKPQQMDKQNANKPSKVQQHQQQQQQGGGNLLKQRKKVMNRSPSNNRLSNNGPMNMNQLNQQMSDSMPRDGNDLFMRKRNFMESDMGGSFDRSDRVFNMAGSNFMNDRNMNNSNNFGNNRGDFGDEFSRRPAKNDGFNHFGGGNRSGNANGGGGGGGGRMFNRY